MDRRVKRTHRLLGEALVDLLQNHDLNEITIRDITEHADVAYSTFFRNFESIDELLLTHLHGFMQKLIENVQNVENAPYPIQSRTTITALFQLIQQDPRLPRILFQNPAAQPILNMFKSAQMRANLHIAQHMDLQLDATQPPFELIINNTMVQMFGMIDWWLNQNMQPAPEVMADYYEQIVLRPMWTLLLGYDGMNALFAE